MSLRERLSRSHVGHWALAYIGGAWLTLQVVDILGDQFQWPLRLQQSVTVVLIAGFFVTVVLAWYHGEQGRQRITAAELLILGTLLLIAAGTLRVLRPPGATAGGFASWPARPASPPTVVAVLPFHNLSGDPRDDHLASGLHEDILTHLSGISSLTVLSRRSVLRYADADRNLPQIGAELGARSLLEGSVRRAGNRLRVTVQLIDAVTDAHVWAETYDRTLDDVFEIQTEVAQRIAETLEATLTPAETRRLVVRPRTGLGAWELVQRARAVGEKTSNLREALAGEEDLLRQALGLDPEYAMAWARLSMNFAQRKWSLAPGPAWGDSALTAAQRAMELDPELAPAHQALADAYNIEGYLDGAEQLYRSALRLDPNLAEAYRELGRLAAVRGRFDEAIELLEDALRRNPHMPSIRTQLGHSFAALGELEEARHWFDAEVELRRRGGLPVAGIQAWAHWWDGQGEAAVEAGVRMAEQAPGNPVQRAGLAELRLMAGDASGATREARSAMEGAGEPQQVAYLFLVTTTLGTALRVDGEDGAEVRTLFEASRSALSEQVDHRDQYPLTYMELAAVEDALGNRPAALRWARRAFDLGSRHLHLIGLHPAFEALRRDLTFQDIVQAMRQDIEEMRARVERRERAAGLR